MPEWQGEKWTCDIKSYEGEGTVKPYLVIRILSKDGVFLALTIPQTNLTVDKGTMKSLMQQLLAKGVV